jgi:site-specific DNA recombinase
MKQKLSAVYVRVSTQDQLEGLSLDVQEKLCRKKSEEEGYKVLTVLSDGGISGHKESRPGMDRLKELIITHEISAVVALSSDRLYRNSRSHIDLMGLIREHDIRLIYISQASPENNASSIMTDSMLANINQFYRDQISDKVKGALYARVEAGYFPALPAPGYINAENPNPNADRISQRIIIPDLIMAPLITELFQLYATGIYSVYDLADHMYEHGLRSHRGYKISQSCLYNLLKNRLYIGEVRWGKAFCKKGKHEPLIDEATFNQVQVVMETKNHKACRRRKYQWLLTGFLYCAHHGKRYVAEWH